MASETVVLDSSNLAAIIADATGEPLEPAKEEAQADAKVDNKTAEKAPAKASEKAAEKAAEDDEDENGLTAAQRAELTAKMQRAVGKKHRQMREAQEQSARERAERLEAQTRLEALERELAQVRASNAPKVEEGPTEPQRADYKTDEEWQNAVFDFRVDQRVQAKLKADKEAAEKEAREAEIERIKSTAAERIAKAMDLVPDYQEVTEAVDILVPSHLAGYMQESELFAELGYHFAKHPEVLERLSALRPDRALVELGKIEDKLQPFSKAQAVEKVEPRNGSAEPSTTDASPSRPRQSAPVIRPLTTRGAPQVEKAESDMDTAEARRSWEKRNGVSLSRRARH